MANLVSDKPISEGELAESKDLDRRFCEALGRKDLDAAMACFWDSPDVVVLIAGNVQRGPAAVRKGIRELFAQNESLRVEISEITYLRSGDGVIGVGTATFNLKPVNGKPEIMVERWSDLRRKIDGRWVYVLDHATIMPK